MLNKILNHSFTLKSAKDYVPKIFKMTKFNDPALRVPKPQRIHPETKKLRDEVN